MCVIEHKWLKPGAPHGKVLPLSAAHASEHAGFRSHFERQYSDIIAVCTAAGDGASMSADTGMQEMLLIGTKLDHRETKSESDQRSVMCVNLTQSFTTRVEAKMYADAIRREASSGNSEGEIVVGTRVGTYIRETGLCNGRPWVTLGASGDYAKLSAHINNGYVWNPITGGVTKFALDMTTLESIVFVGDGFDTIGSTSDSRGAFKIVSIPHDRAPYHPSMWEVGANLQTAITCAPTHKGIPRGTKHQMNSVTENAGHFHIVGPLRMSSQRITMAYTESKALGGRGWVTLKAEDPRILKALTLFLNSTFGIIVRVGKGQKTQIGRAPMAVKSIRLHPVPDFAADTDHAEKARNLADKRWDAVIDAPLNRISLSAIDSARKDIGVIVFEMLLTITASESDVSCKHMDMMLDAWRKKLCRQPIVHGNTKLVLKKLRDAEVLQ